MLVTAELAILGHGVLAAPLLVFLLLIAYLCSPLHPRSRSGHWEAQQRHVRHATVVAYWRPGCMFCLRLRWALRRAGVGPAQIDWVDIWHDAEAAAYVRDLNEGSETVPTVILPDGSAHTNPDPARVVSALRTAAESPPGADRGRAQRPSQPHPDRGRPSAHPSAHPSAARSGRPRPGSGVSRGPRGGRGAS